MTLSVAVISPGVCFMVGMAGLPRGGLRLDAGMFVERAAYSGSDAYTFALKSASK